MVLVGTLQRLQFEEGVSVSSLGVDGTETFDISGLGEDIKPRQAVKLVVHRSDGKIDEVPLTLRIDTAVEVDYYRHGGILPYVLRQLLDQR